MLSLFFWALCVLALGPQVVRARSFKFSFSRVAQCAPVSLSFEGESREDNVPTMLTLLPFNATPIVIPIPPTAINSSGVNITFLPLTTNTMFVASLDNSELENSAKISDTTRIFPSDDTSCLPTQPSDFVPPFVLPENVTQCEVFQVLYTGTAPRVRVLSPRGGGDEADVVEDFPDEGRATYMMKKIHGQQVVLVAFQDDIAQGWSSQLLTVQGDSESSKECGRRNNDEGENGQANAPSSTESNGISNGVIIGLSVGGGIVLLIAVAMALYLIHLRRRRRRVTHVAFNPALLEKLPPSEDEKRSIDKPISPSTYQLSPPVSLPYNGPYPEGEFVRNPPYAMEYSPTFSGFRDSSGSWISERAALRRQGSQGATSLLATQGRTSINPYDIERMLDLATPQSPHNSAPLSNTPTPNIPEIREPEPTVNLRAAPRRRGFPDAPSSMTTSVYSINPFTDTQGYVMPLVQPLPSAARSSRHLSHGSTTEFGPQNTRSSSTDMPPSPRQGLRVPRSRFSDPSLMDGGSIGGFPMSRQTASRDSGSSWGNTTTAGIAR